MVFASLLEIGKCERLSSTHHRPHFLPSRGRDAIRPALPVGKETTYDFVTLCEHSLCLGSPLHLVP